MSPSRRRLAARLIVHAVAACAAWTARAAAAAPAPVAPPTVEQFFRTPAIRSASLSPNGRYVASTAMLGGSIQRERNSEQNSAYSGLFAIDRDGTRERALSPMPGAVMLWMRRSFNQAASTLFFYDMVQPTDDGSGAVIALGYCFSMTRGCRSGMAKTCATRSRNMAMSTNG